MKLFLSKTKYAVLPLLILTAVGVSLGPDGWRVIGEWIAGICRSAIAEAGALEIGIGSVALVSAGALAAGLWTAVRLGRRQMQFTGALREHIRESDVRSPGAPEDCLTVADDKPFAFCYGLLRPQIYVSSSLIELLTPHEFEAVLAHERAHRRRKDPLRIAIAHVFSGALALIPPFRILADRYLLSLELKADQAALQHVETGHLTAALVRMLKSRAGYPLPSAVSGFDHLAARLDALINSDGSTTARTGRLRRRYVVAGAVWASLITAGWAYAVYGTATVLAAAPACRMEM